MSVNSTNSVDLRGKYKEKMESTNQYINLKDRCCTGSETILTYPTIFILILVVYE